MQRIPRFPVATALVLVLLASCATVRGGEEITEGATIHFANDTPNAVTVFAMVQSISAVNLGVVMQGERRTLQIPARVLNRSQTVDLVAQRPGGSSARSGPVQIAGGAQLRVTMSMASTQLIVEPLIEAPRDTQPVAAGSRPTG